MIFFLEANSLLNDLKRKKSAKTEGALDNRSIGAWKS